MREPRFATLRAVIEAALREHKPLTERVYAQAVADLYHERTALHERTIDFHVGATADTFEAAQRANAQLVKRMLTGEVRAPIDVEEAMVLALPEPWQRRAMQALAERTDHLAVPRPQPGAGLTSAADLMRECGEALQRLAPMLADGKFDASDRSAAPAALRELDELIAAACCLRLQVRTGTGVDIPNVASIRRA